MTKRLKPVLDQAALGALAALACAMFAFSDAAYAQRANNDEEEEQSSGTIDERTGEILNEAIEFLNTENYAAARTAMGELRMDRLSPYERSRAEQILFQIAYASESYDEARTHLQAAIDAGGLTEQEQLTLRFQIAQSFMVEERWAEGARALEAWFALAPSPNGSAYYLLAVAYYQMEDFTRALTNAERAVALTESPQENWLTLVLALYIQQERFRDCVPLLQRLIGMAPEKKTYWVQLSSVHGQLDDYESALSVMQLAYLGGLLDTDADFRRLADLLYANDVPYRGGVVLEEAIADRRVAGDVEAYEKLANMWIAAREYDRAIDPLERAATGARTGDLFVRLGEVHVQRNDWAAAGNALRRGIDKGGLRDSANAQLLMGVALFEQDRLTDAVPYFERAARSEQRGDTARGYLQFIEARLEAEGGDEPAAEETDAEATAEDADEATPPAEGAPAVDGAPPAEGTPPAEESPATEASPTP